MYLIYNRKLTNEKDFHSGIDNRAFNYGDGLFETIIAKNKRILFLEDHIERLKAGIAAIALNIPEEINYQSLEKNITSLLKENKHEEVTRIKIIVWRKSGGLFSPASHGSEYLISTSPKNDQPAVKERVLFFNDVRLSFSPVSKFKTLSSLPYILAGIAKTDMNADDVILSDHEGNIGECLASNIFWTKDQVVYTPSLETGCKDGIMRKQILRFLKKENIKVVEGKFKKEDLLKADLVFTSNVSGLIPITKIEGQSFKSSSKLFERLLVIGH
jgi:4-amino-4-deoxychorismate lyase